MSDPTTTARETAEREGEAHIAESAVIVLDAGTPSTPEIPSIELKGTRVVPRSQPH